MSFKRLLSLVLVLCMVLSFFPASAFADNDVAEEEVVEEVVEEPVAEEPAPEEETPPPAEEEQPAPAAAEEEEEIVEEEIVAEAQTVSEEAMLATVALIHVGTSDNQYPSLGGEFGAFANANLGMIYLVADPTESSATATLGTELAGNAHTVTGDIVINAPDKTVSFANVTIDGNITVVAGEFTVTTDVTVTGTITVNGGTFKSNGGTYDAVTVDGGTLNISNGKFGAVTVKSGTININGGEFDSAVTSTDATAEGIVGNVAGGRFTNGITDYLCANDCLYNTTSKAVEKVTLPKKIAAQIGEGINRQRFLTFTDAAKAAGGSVPVVLLGDAYTGQYYYTLGGGKTLIVDKNGHKFNTPVTVDGYMVEWSSEDQVFTYTSVPIVAVVGKAEPATSTDLPFASFAGAVSGRTPSADVIKLVATDAGAYTLAFGDTLKVMLNGKDLTVSAPEGYVISKTGPDDKGVTTYKAFGTYRVVDMPASPTDASWTLGDGTDYKDTELEAAVTAAMNKTDKVLVLLGSGASVTFAANDKLNVYAGKYQFTAVAAPGVMEVTSEKTAIEGVDLYKPSGTFVAKVSIEGEDDQYFPYFTAENGGALPYANNFGGTVSFLVQPKEQNYTMIANGMPLVIDWARYNKAITIEPPAGFVLNSDTEGTVTTYSLTAAVAMIDGKGYFETFEEAAKVAAASPTDLTIVLLDDIMDPDDPESAYTYTMDPKLADTMKVNHNGHSLTVAAPAGYALKDNGKLVPETTRGGQSVTNTSGEHVYTIVGEFTFTFDADNGTEPEVVKVYADQTYNPGAKEATKTGYKLDGWYVGDEKIVGTVTPTQDLYLKAHWNANKYRFIAESMATPTDTYDYTRVVDFGEKITAPPDVPVAPDKTFEYWAYLNKKDLWIGGKTPTYTKVDFPFTLDAEALDRLLLVSPDPDSRYTDKDEGVFYFYAVFKDDVYSVTFDADGGTFRSSKSGAYVSSIENIDLEVGADLEYPNTEPVREGYDFLGWNYEGGFIPGPDTIPVLPSKMPAEDRNYVAQWEAVNYAINYKGTSDKTLPKSFTVEDLPLTINEIGYPGYTFEGWTSTVLGISDEMVAVIPVGTATATDLTANWTMNEYAIKYDLAGGAFQAGDPGPTSYNVENAFTIPQPVKDGFTFIGWTGTGLTEPTAVVYIAAGTTGDLEFTANWSVKPVNVLINYNDGGQTKNDKYIVKFGDPINQPTIPAYEGHSLIGWSLTPAGEEGYAVDEFPYVLPEYAVSVTLTGQWKTNVHSVTFQAGEGAFPGGSKEAVQPSVAFGTEMNYDRIVSPPERTGYKFDGWVLRDGEKAPATMPDEDLVLYASYVPAEYNVTYSVATNTDAKIINPETGLEVDSYTFKLAYGETLPEAPAAVYAGHEYVWVEDYYGYNAPAEMPAEDLNFTAKWTGVSVTVKFDGGGGLIKDRHGDFVPSYFVTGTVEDTLTFPPESKAEGYTGHAWVDEADPAGTHISVLPTTFPLVDTTYKLIWDINKWNVTFSGGGAKIVNPETGIEGTTFTLENVEYGAQVVYPKEPVLEGYTFNAWKEAKAGFTPVTTMPDRNLSFVADWIADEHTVTLDANGGKFVNVLGEESETFTVTGKFGDSVVYPDDPELEGYTLVAWADEEGNNVDLRTRSILAEDVTYTAVWQIKTVPVTYVPNGGTAVHPTTYWPTTDNFVINYNYGDELLLPQVSRDGFEFGGWVENTTYGWNYPATVTDVPKMQFTAVWVGEDFTLSFDANGGTVETRALSQGTTATHTDIVPKYAAVVNADPDTLAEAVKKALPIPGTQTEPNPVKLGYSFESWIDENDVHWTDDELETLVTNFPYVNKSFKANWTVNKYPVKFDGMGGDLINPNTGLPAPGQEYIQMVEFGTAIPFPADPVREGYTFVGWAETQDGYGYNHPKTMPVPKDIATGLVFTAQWKAEEHSVTLDANGGKFVNALGEESETFTVTGKFGESFTYAADPKFEGYTLVGWADEDGNKVDTRTYTIPAEDVTYTAVWQIKKVTVTYAVRGGTAIHPDTYVPTTIDFDVVYNFGDELVLPTITRDGFDFGGWVEDTYGWNYPATIPDVTKMVFKAVWVGEDFTLSFDADGGTVETRALSYSLATHTDIVPEYTAVVNADPATLADAVRKALPIAGTSTNPNPVKEGYSFESWIDENDVHWTDADLATLATNFPYVNKSFKANWTVNKYQVKFDGMGGDLINPNTGLPAPGQEYTQKVEFGTAIPFPADPVREGYTFVGWAETKDGYGYNHPKTMPVPNSADGLVFTAQWKANEYTVSYDANGGIMETKALDTDTHTDKVSFYSITGKAGDPMINPLSITREGYKFHGWVDQDGKHYEAGQLPATIPTKNTMYVAIWEVESYWVTFDAINGRTYAAKAELMNPNTGMIEADGRYEQKVVFGTEIPFPADPVLKGYTFVGWAEVQDKYGYNHPETMPVPKTDYGLVFEAQWVPEEHTITFDANGGAFKDVLGQLSEIYEITDKYGASVSYPYPPTREGYRLVGWNGSDGKVYTAPWGSYAFPATMPAEDLTLVAVWEIEEYYVTFKPGSVGNAATIVNPLTDVPVKGQEVKIAVTYGETIPYAEIFAPGYDFDGWVDSVLGYKLPETMPARGVDLTAMWKGLDYSLTFDANGGLVRTWALSAIPGNNYNPPYGPNDPVPHEDSVPSYTAVYNVTASPTDILYLLPLSDPTRDGYTFESWIDNDTGKHWSSDDLNMLSTNIPFANKTFTANWTVNPYTVTFNAAGGWVIDPATLVRVPLYQNTFNYGDAIVYPNDPTRVGYEFKGWLAWTDEGDFLGYVNPETMPACDLVLFARWTPIPNTVVYNANGGTVLNKLGQPVEVLTIEAPTGAPIYRPEEEPERYGYDFVGWFDHNDDKVATPTDIMPAEGETYTAMWTAKKINVTFYTKAGDAEPYLKTTVKFEDLVKQPLDPIVTGMTFEGWYTYAGSGLNIRYLEPFDFSKPVDSEEDINLVGKWSTAVWTVSFDSNGGKNTIPDQFVEHGSKATEPQGMYRSGYKFVEWRMRNDNGTLGPAWNFNWTVVNDLDLVAIWSGKEVTLRWTDRNVYFVDQNVKVGDFIIRPEFEDYTFQQLIRDGRTEGGVHYRLDPDNLWDPMPGERVEENYGAHFTFMLNWIRQSRVILVTEKGVDIAYVDNGMTLGEAIDAGLISAPAKPGYKVVWMSNGKPVDEDDVIKEGMTLNATYVVYEPVVTFMTNESVYRTEEVTYGGTVTKPADPKPTELGVKFAGWAEEGSTVLFDFSTPITEDKVLEAVWEALVPDFTVTFMNNNAVYSVVKVADGDLVVKPEDPTPAVLGVKFDAWYEMNSTVPFDFSTPITKNVVLEARWEPFVEEYSFLMLLNMEDYTGINVFVHIPDGENPANYVLKTVSTNSMYTESSQEIEVSLADLRTRTRDGVLYYRLPDAMKAASTEMTDKLAVTLLKDGKEVKTEEYSIYSIVEERLASGTLSPADDKLHRALLQYGRSAQIAFDHKTTDMPEVTGAPALVAIPSSYAAKGDPTNFGAYIAKFEGSVEMAEAAKMNIYLTPAAGYSTNDFEVSVTKDGVPYEKVATSTSRGRIKVQISGFASFEMDSNVQITVKVKSTGATATWTRSLMTCAYEKFMAETEQPWKNLWMSLYQYFLTAQDAFIIN